MEYSHSNYIYNYLWIIYDCFCVITEELWSCDRNCLISLLSFALPSSHPLNPAPSKFFPFFRLGLHLAPRPEPELLFLRSLGVQPFGHIRFIADWVIKLVNDLAQVLPGKLICLLVPPPATQLLMGHSCFHPPWVQSPVTALVSSSETSSTPYCVNSPSTSFNMSQDLNLLYVPVTSYLNIVNRLGLLCYFWFKDILTLFKKKRFIALVFSFYILIMAVCFHIETHRRKVQPMNLSFHLTGYLYSLLYIFSHWKL